ncbi:MAG: endopeptidase La [Planctomycetota bacterium]
MEKRAAKEAKPATKKKPKLARLKQAKPRRSKSEPSVDDRASAEREAGVAGERLIILAARGSLLFPRVVLPMVVGRQRSIEAIQAAVGAEEPIGVLLQRDPEVENPSPEDLYRVGTVATIIRYLTAPDGSHHVFAHGESRFRVLSFEQTDPYLVARVERLAEPEVHDDAALEARMLALRAESHRALSLLPQKPEELDQAIENADSASGLTDLVATFLDIPVEERQEILETLELGDRMDLVIEKLGRLVEVLRLSKEIRERTHGTMQKAQREHYLREQLRQIQEELGEGRSVEVADLAKQIDSGKLPEEVQREAQRDLDRLMRMPEAAAEYGMLRGYLETLVELPWGEYSQDAIDLEVAQRILDEDHYGLEKVKRRIVEFLAVTKLAPAGKSPILCFVGPPGVGKTSLGRSIARAMGRKFVRMSLGGVHDESEIRGHRRTYVGAMPGSIVQQIRKAKSMNPVFLLDEMDKLGQSVHGDPSSALLEVLDPEQNRAFVDHYLNVPLDLSRVLFLATANVLENVPRPLRDRCEVIDLPGYTEEEKLQIARRYLVARQLEANGVDAEQFSIDDDAILALIRSYTREAGVRNLERELGAVIRSAAVGIAGGSQEHVAIEAEDLPEILGPARFGDEVEQRTGQPGVATGLAWTPVGGDVLFVEAAASDGKGELLLTGQLGDVMKESAHAALTLIKSHAARLGIDPARFARTDLHVHVPAGAIPKDGPSAGVTIFAALASLFTGRAVRPDLAMTGEISLRGLVLPVGGIKEKVIAAKRHGLEHVALPARNKKDLPDVPESARTALEFHWLENVDQLVELALAVPEPDEPEQHDGQNERQRVTQPSAARDGAQRSG